MKRFRLSLTSMFLLTAIIALVIAWRLEVAQLSKELNSVVPLREMEIVGQIERQTAAAKTPVTVISVMCSGNTYHIRFEYFDPETGARTTSSFNLTLQESGRYVGAIRDDPFLSPVPDAGGERGLRITVVDPLFSKTAKAHDGERGSKGN